jgi:hypothetical protein
MVELSRSVTIFDDPESKIQYLETLLKGQHWSANIVVNPRTLAAGVTAQQQAETLSHTLEGKGYATHIASENGQYVVHLESIDKDTNFIHLIRDMGLSKGLGYTVSHLHVPLQASLNKVFDYASYIAHEPARLFSGIYLMGDVLFMLSGLKNEKSHGNFFEKISQEMRSLKDPKNLLQTVAGKMAVVQSLIYMNYANSGSELAYSGLKAHHKAHIEQGVDPTNISAWSASESQQSKPSVFGHILKKYPIETGALAQIFGQVAFIGTSLMQIKQGQVTQGARMNIARGLTAIVAWSMFMKKPVHTEHKSDWQSAPLQRGWQEFSEHPERFASIINTAASGIGLYASRKTGNHFQKYAESLWLVGDAIMFFAKSNHYGAAAARQEVPMVEAATRFMKELPLALSPEARATYLSDLSDYLATHALKERNEKSSVQLVGDAYIAEHDRLKVAINDGVNTALASTPNRYDTIITQAARLIERFDVKDRPELVKRLAHGLHEARGIYGKPEDIEQSLTKQLRDSREVGGIKPPVLGEVIGDVQALVSAASGISAPYVALAVYDALAPSLSTSRMDVALLDKHLKAIAAKKLEVSPQALEPSQSRGHAA